MKNRSCPRVIFCQPALPAYRIDFFDRLANRLGSRFALYYSPTDMGVLTQDREIFSWERPVGAIRPLLRGVVEWQPGALSIPMKRGDTLIVCGGPRTLSTLALLLKARWRRVNTIWFGHYWSSTSTGYLFRLRIALMRLVDAILFYTDQEVDEYRAGFGRHDKRLISAINNGINTDPIVAVSVPYQAERRPRDILLIGRIQEKCRAELLLYALTDRRLAGIRLQIVGDGPERMKLEALAERLELSDAIVWHGGIVNEAEIAKIANRCRIFVYPGAVGLSLIHSMAYGLPAIVNDDRWGNMPEITAFSSGVTGVSFTKGDAADLADKIAQTIDDDEALNRWSEEAQRRASQLYNTRGMADRVLQMLDALEESR